MTKQEVVKLIITLLIIDILLTIALGFLFHFRLNRTEHNLQAMIPAVSWADEKKCEEEKIEGWTDCKKENSTISAPVVENYN